MHLVLHVKTSIKIMFTEYFSVVKSFMKFQVLILVTFLLHIVSVFIDETYVINTEPHKYLTCSHQHNYTNAICAYSVDFEIEFILCTHGTLNRFFTHRWILKYSFKFLLFRNKNID